MIASKHVESAELIEFTVNGVNLAIIYDFNANKSVYQPPQYVLERTNIHPSLIKYWHELTGLTTHVSGTPKYPVLRKPITKEDVHILLANTEYSG